MDENLRRWNYWREQQNYKNHRRSKNDHNVSLALFNMST